MELILEKLIPVVGSKGWKNPKNKNVKYLFTDSNGNILKYYFDLSILFIDTIW